MRSGTLVVMLGIATGLGCNESPVGLDAYSPVPCAAPASAISPAALDGITSDAIRTAVLDAGDRIAASLPAGADADELRRALVTLDSHVSDTGTDTACRLLHIAALALERQPDDPATLPDRAALRLHLDLVSAALTRDAQ